MGVWLEPSVVDLYAIGSEHIQTQCLLMARWADLEIVDEECPPAVRIKPGWNVSLPPGVVSRLSCSIAAEVQTSCIKPEDHTPLEENNIEGREQSREISKCLLRSVYTTAFPSVSFHEHAKLCSYHVKVSAPLRKAHQGERPVPPNIWKGAGPFKQKAMLRHFRGLGWGPHTGLDTKRRRLRQRNSTSNDCSAGKNVYQEQPEGDDPADLVEPAQEFCNEGTCRKSAEGSDSADVEEQGNRKQLV